MRREICIKQVRKWTVSIQLQYPIMVIMSFCSSSVIFSFKVRYCGKREIFLRFCGITYPPMTPLLNASYFLLGFHEMKYLSYRAPHGENGGLQCSTMGIVWAPGLHAFKMMGSKAPGIPPPKGASILVQPFTSSCLCFTKPVSQMNKLKAHISGPHQKKRPTSSYT